MAWVDINNLLAKAPLLKGAVHIKILKLKNSTYSKLYNPDKFKRSDSIKPGPTNIIKDPPVPNITKEPPKNTPASNIKPPTTNTINQKITEPPTQTPSVKKPSPPSKPAQNNLIPDFFPDVTPNPNQKNELSKETQ